MAAAPSAGRHRDRTADTASRFAPTAASASAAVRCRPPSGQLIPAHYNNRAVIISGPERQPSAGPAPAARPSADTTPAPPGPSSDYDGRASGPGRPTRRFLLRSDPRPPGPTGHGLPPSPPPNKLTWFTARRVAPIASERNGRYIQTILVKIY